MRPSYNEIDRDHRARLVRTASKYYKLGRDPAEDVVQATLLKAWLALPDNEFESNKKVMAWLNKILRNTALDYIREVKNLREDSIDSDTGQSYGSDFDAARGIEAAMSVAVIAPGRNRSRGPASAAARPVHIPARSVSTDGHMRGGKPLRVVRDLPSDIDTKRAIAKLTPAQRGALSLSVAGHTFHEIGAALKCSEDAARDRVRRARATLTECAA
ncbi:MAG: sigma-70 family RNA polymerase sigma factor [Sulfuricaulis sp.]|nr:sigma-70 family RNA polymerase sigma factor [Sulfuricaulis sp.]